MEKQDLRDYSENELSLIVFNDEYLYIRRHNIRFLEMLKSRFIFTEEQLEILKTDLEEEEEE